MGSLEELIKLAGIDQVVAAGVFDHPIKDFKYRDEKHQFSVKNSNLHRQFVDKIEIPDPRGPEYPKMRRIEPVFDCWFESGSMPYG